MAVGGAAYLVSKAIRASRVVAFADLGMEAIYEFDGEGHARDGRGRRRRHVGASHRSARMAAEDRQDPRHGRKLALAGVSGVPRAPREHGQSCFLPSGARIPVTSMPQCDRPGPHWACSTQAAICSSHPTDRRHRARRRHLSRSPATGVDARPAPIRMGLHQAQAAHRRPHHAGRHCSTSHEWRHRSSCAIMVRTCSVSDRSTVMATDGDTPTWRCSTPTAPTRSQLDDLVGAASARLAAGCPASPCAPTGSTSPTRAPSATSATSNSSVPRPYRRRRLSALAAGAGVRRRGLIGYLRLGMSLRTCRGRDIRANLVGALAVGAALLLVAIVATLLLRAVWSRRCGS